ncbi:DciA family protein [uncultured Nitrosomonas sp.]|uniref:DciA family protein n=1 Tax=uncultured Nitrosomonas sp. TaxID=156424 RepID=UPI0025CE12F0|nr:DciA family protein [uncultured Nitrosomonas sp.]
MFPLKVDTYLDPLGKTPEYAGLLSSARQLHEAQSTFFKLIPTQLIQYCRMGRILDGKLTILVENGAIASKLKQISPSLLVKLQQLGWKVTAFQILVQAHNSARNSRLFEKQGHSKRKLKLSQTGKKCLTQLAATMPDSELRNTIQLFVGKHQNDPADHNASET